MKTDSNRYPTAFNVVQMKTMIENYDDQTDTEAISQGTAGGVVAVKFGECMLERFPLGMGTCPTGRS